MKAERERYIEEEEEEKYSDYHHQQIFYISLSVSSRRLIIHCSSLSIWLEDRLDRRIASLVFFS